MVLRLKYVIILLILILSSCKGKDSEFKIIDNIDLFEWSKKSLEHADKFCNLSKNEYSNESPAVVNKVYDTLTITSHFKEILIRRELLVNTLKKDKLFSQDDRLIIIESYTNSKSDWKPISKDVFYKVFSEKSKICYSFFNKYGEDTFLNERLEWENPNKIVLEGDVSCLNELSIGYPIGEIRIKNKISFDDSNTIKYQIEYMYIGK